ncbi:MAG TPA: hypothetical protein VJS44_08400 [Pyrinomonadaceae bacterium]|nr:hypothetical protein [Pyrinomonadaceae bacterium]
MDTTGEVIAGVYTLLRRPSDPQQLAYLDVLERLNDILRGYVQDMDLGGRDRRTETAEVAIDEDDIDYLIRLPNVPDFEPVSLEYGLTDSTTQSWRAAQVVSFNSWPKHYGQGYVAASFYGSSGLQEGIKARLSLTPDEVGRRTWRITYRLPLLAIVQMGERPPIPTNFLPMLKYETAIACMPIVNDDSDEWKAWKKENLPVYVGLLQGWKERWEEYLSSSVEPNQQPLRGYNDFRRRRLGNPRACLPIR